jgi:hypothetical protein
MTIEEFHPLLMGHAGESRHRVGLSFNPPVHVVQNKSRISDEILWGFLRSRREHPDRYSRNEVN